MFEFTKAYPEEVGIPSDSIKNMLLFLDKKDIPMHSLLIMRKDKLVFEKYYAPYKKDTLHRMFSISKTFTALAISLLADEGKVDLDHSITDYFPEYTNADTHPWIRETTIRNMLMMRTCHASSTYKVDMTSNWVESFFTVPPTHKPGTVFHYDTSGVHVLGALVEKLTGMELLEYLRERFLKYLDFSDNSYMVKDPFGVSIAGSGLMATPMDILKVLYVIDHKGVITCNDGVKRNLLDSSFIEEATKNLSDNIMTGPLPSESAGYGMQIWQNEAGGYVLYGMGGQLAISIPDKELLIMTSADTQGIAGGNQVIYDSIYNILLPSLDRDVKRDSAPRKSYEDLMEYADSLRISLPRIPGKQLQTKELPDFIKALSSEANVQLKYRLQDNRQNFASLELSLLEEGISSLKLIPKAPADSSKSASAEPIEISFGFHQMIEGDIKKYDAHYTAGAIWLRENVLYIRLHLIGECVGSIRFELYFGDKDVTLFMRKIEETYFKEFDGHLYGSLM